MELKQRIEEILTLIQDGYTRDQIAKHYGHTGRETINQFMRRAGYIWDKTTNNYQLSPKHPDYKAPPRRPSIRVVDIIAAFQKPDADAEAIAKSLRFANGDEMGGFMLKNGYRWSSENGNYVTDNQDSSDEEFQFTKHRTTDVPQPTGAKLPTPPLNELVSFITKLKANESRLYEILGRTETTVLTMPRYHVGGLSITKSIQLSSTLDQMVKEFSREHNVRQREVFEVALLEFFQQHGYEERLEGVIVY